MGNSRGDILIAALVGTASVLALVIACSSTPAPVTPTPTVTRTAAPTPTADSGPAPLRVVVASTDLAIGSNRFAFAVLDEESKPLRRPEALATFVYLETDPAEIRIQATSTFVTWPSSRAGVFTSNVSFDAAGRWGVLVTLTLDDGTEKLAQSGFEVKPESAAPSIGQPAPRSLNRTIRDASDLSEITSAGVPDPDLYQITIAEAVGSGRPTVVTFATPLFCQTATCGPQVQVVSDVKDGYLGRANFIHVEVYENLKEMEGDISRGRLSPLLDEWRLVTEPFTFVIDRNGLIAAKFEGFVTGAELDQALGVVLGQ